MRTTEIEISQTQLQQAVQSLLEDAGLGECDIDKIMKLVEEAELNKCERDYDRQQERLMENGTGSSLLDQQRAAMKFK